MKKTSVVKGKMFVTYAIKNLMLIKMMKMHLNYIIKEEIIVITQKI